MDSNMALTRFDAAANPMRTIDFSGRTTCAPNRRLVHDQRGVSLLRHGPPSPSRYLGDHPSVLAVRSVWLPVPSGIAKWFDRHTSQEVCPWNAKFSREA